MFVKERRRDEEERAEINRTKFSEKTKCNQGYEHRQVQPLRETKTAGDPEFDDERTQTFAAIEIVILRRVDEVEAAHPAKHAEAENERRQREPASLSKPGSDWCDGQSEAEKKMRRVCETLRYGVKENDCQRRRGEQSSHSIDGERAQDEGEGAKDEEEYGGRFGNEKMASSGARVALIERPINDAIEEHRCRSRKNHAKYNEQQNARRRMSVRGDDKRAERERQGEDRVRKANQLQKACDRIPLICGGWDTRHQVKITRYFAKVLRAFFARSASAECRARKASARNCNRGDGAEIDAFPLHSNNTSAAGK